MKKFKVILYRSKHRFVKSQMRDSKYAAKILKREWEEKYDETYSVEITKVYT